jgi:hypothetical protein
MKVKALIMFNDLEAKKIRKPGEVFEVSEKRAEELSSAHNGTLIEVIDKTESGENDVRKNKAGTKNKK